MVFIKRPNLADNLAKSKIDYKYLDFKEHIFNVLKSQFLEILL